MYRNVYYQCNEDTNWQGLITLDTWDENGNPISKTFEYPSHLYYVDETGQEKESEYTTITNKPLVRKEFSNIFARKKWIQEHPRVKLYDCLDPVTGFLHDNFYEINEQEDFAEFPLKIYSWDIETAVSEGFPDYNNPRDPLTVQTFSNIATNEVWTWILLAGDWKKDLTPDDFKNTDKRTYFVFKNERDMYIHFLDWFKHNRPDIITGWNIDAFDLPYTVNRIAEILSLHEVAEAFSPIGAMRKKFVKPTVKSRGYDSYRFEGLTFIDYMQIYRDKFCKNSMVIDFKLETVCQEELGVGKLQYEGTFKQFYLRDFKTFVEYNIIDVIRINDLERKKKLLALTRYMCNASLCTYDKILAAQPIVIGALNILTKRNKQLMMSDDRIDPELKYRSFEGAFVYPVEPCKCGAFATFDLNSLYPNIIISINISPETYVGKVEGYTTDEWTVNIKGKIKTMSKQAFIEKFGSKLNIAPNGALFLKQHIKEGVCSQYEKKFYFGRKQSKKTMIEYEKKAAELLKQIRKTDKKFDPENASEILDTDIKKEWRKLTDTANFYSNKQLAEKLNLNSLYGLFSSKFSPICMIDCGEAITSAGRVIIQNSMKFIDDFINYKITKNDEYKHFVMFGDSVAGNSILEYIDYKTNKISKLTFDEYFKTRVFNITQFSDGSLRGFTLDKVKNIIDGKITWSNVLYMYAHRTSKPCWKIKALNFPNYVEVTNDHSVIVIRDNQKIKVKPEEIDSNKDKLLIDLNNDYIEASIESCTYIRDFDNELVYDLSIDGPKDQHSFIANGIMVSNTDSFGADIQPLVKKILKELPKEYTEEQVTEVCDVLDNKLVPLINKNCAKIVKDFFLSDVSTIEFKREKFCDHACFLAKKNYMVHVLNNEGVYDPHFLNSGNALKKSALPTKLKNALKVTLEDALIRDWSSSEFTTYCNELYNDVKETWDINDFTKSVGYNTEKVFRKPFDLTGVSASNAIAANLYNNMLDYLNITKKYDPIRVGDKFRYVYVKPDNKWGINYIGFNGVWPEEFNEHLEIDYRTTFNKFFLKPIEKFIQIFKWKMPDVTRQAITDIDDL